jgi:hypothetical protein
MMEAAEHFEVGNDTGRCVVRIVANASCIMYDNLSAYARVYLIQACPSTQTYSQFQPIESLRIKSVEATANEIEYVPIARA